MEEEAGTRQDQADHLFHTQATPSSGHHPAQKHSKDQSESFSNGTSVFRYQTHTYSTERLRQNGNERRRRPPVEETVARDPPPVAAEGEADEQEEDRRDAQLGAEEVEILGLDHRRRLALADATHLPASPLHRLLHERPGEAGEEAGEQDREDAVRHPPRHAARREGRHHVAQSCH